jgi:acetyltransferase-like isoleucine patch superfamily enzyme
VGPGGGARHTTPSGRLRRLRRAGHDDQVPPFPTESELEVQRSLVDEMRAGGIITQWGTGTYGVPQVICFPGDSGRLAVGAYCSISVAVQIFLGGEHRTDWLSTFPFRVAYDLPGAWTDGTPTSRGDVTIGNDVWLGLGCTIRSGVTIGDGAVVGTQAVVTRDVAPYTVVGGNPAEPVRRRFSEDDIARLRQTRWWEWPEAEIITIVDLLNSPDVDGLVHYAAQRTLPRSPDPRHPAEPRRG